MGLPVKQKMWDLRNHFQEWTWDGGDALGGWGSGDRPPRKRFEYRVSDIFV